jgi:hypothetical protein
MDCPHCGKDIADSIVRTYVSSQNGKARGKKKARTSEQMRAAARVRWDKHK